MEVALRVNLYRKDNLALAVPDSARKVPESATKIPEKNNISDQGEFLTDQEKKIYNTICDKDSVTTTEAGAILSVKRRRAATILKNMEDSGIIKKHGASKNTKYVLSDL